MVEKIPYRGCGGAVTHEVLRLRKAIRKANRLAPLRMTELRAVVLLLTMFGARAAATTYYVSSSTGSDSNSGTSMGAAWQTLAKVNAQTFAAGDSILFKRGDVWNESLAPPSSGTSGNSITFDAYGAGAAPNLTGYYAVPASSWTLVTTNTWKAPLPATYNTINFCLFGSIWGQKVAASSSNLTAQWDFYLASGFIHVYSVGNPGSFYNAPIVPMALSNVPVINVNGKSWLTFQHFLMNWFDEYGVYVQGTSDHLVFANMEADSMIPQGTQPLGFYVNESTQPADIRFYNDEAHLNYDGFRFDGFIFNGTGTPITLVNDKAYANRDGALVDNTGRVGTPPDPGGPGAATYSNCHFYGSSLAVANSTDVEWPVNTLGPKVGTGNIGADTQPAVQVWQRYPAQVTLTVDDVGMTLGADTYYASTVLPIADTAGVPVGTAITVGYTAAMTPTQVSALVSEIQGWINAGRDVTSHSMSHTYYPNTDALDIQYTGSGTGATLNISGKTLTITVTGASDSVTYNLAQGQAQGTIKALRMALQATGKFTATENPVCQGPYGTGCSINTEAALLSQDLADISGQDVKSAIYSMLLDTTRLTTDEITLSRQWMTSNLTGLPSTPVYIYPGGYETTAMQGISAAVPYAGARGALKEDLGVKDTFADGFNVQNITSFGVNPTWQGLQPAALNQKIQALAWKEQVWGVPWGVFWHKDELTETEITNLIEDLKNSGVTILSNTGLVNSLLTGTQEGGTDGNFYYKSPAASMTLDFRPAAASPVVDAGQNLGSAYALDINGVNQNSYGSRWEIGAHAFIPYATYGVGGATSGEFTIGGGTLVADDSAYCPASEVAAYPGGATTDGPASLPQNCINTAITNWTQPATVKWTCPAGQTIPTDSLDGRGGQACDYATLAATLAAMPANGCGVWYKIKSTSGTTLASEPAGTQNIYAENNLTIPAGVGCTKSNPVWITTDQYPSLAATGLGEGQRATMGWVGTTSGTTTMYPAYGNPTAPGIYFPEIRNGGVNVPTLSADATTAHLRVMGIEFTSAAGVAIDNKLIVLPAGSDHIILDRDLIHCGDSKTLTHSNSACSSGMFFGGTYEALINSTDADIWCGTGLGYGQCPEGHGMGWGTTTTASNEGPYKVVNDFISAGGEEILTGGGATVLTPVDAEIRRNSFYKPLYWDDYSCYNNNPWGPSGSLPSWCVDGFGNPVHTWSKFEISSITCSAGVITATSTLPPIFIPPIAGTSKVSFINVTDANFNQSNLLVGTSTVTAGVLTLTASTSGTCDPSSSGGEMSFGGIEVKNHLEFKNQNRALVEGNTFTNDWWGDSDQFGEALHLNPIGGPSDTVPGGVAVQNVTLRYNLVQHANKGIAIAEEIDGLVGTGAIGPFSIHDNMFDDINGTKWAVRGDGRLSIFTSWGSLPYGQQSLTITSASGSLSCSGNVVTAKAYYNPSSPSIVAGQKINVTGASLSAYNGGPFTLASATNNAGGAGYPISTLTWPVVSCPGSSSANGTILGVGPGGSPYNVSVAHNTAILNLTSSVGSNRLGTANMADNSNVTPLTGTASVDATGLIVTYASGNSFVASCSTYGNGGWVGAPFIINGVGAYPVAASPCPTSTSLTLTTPATSVAGTTIGFTAPCVTGCTTNLSNPWSGISLIANLSPAGINPTGFQPGGGTTGAANAYLTSTSCGSGTGGATNVCWCISDNLWPSAQVSGEPNTLPYPSANPAGNVCSNSSGGNNLDTSDHTLATVGFANYNSGQGGGDYTLCTGVGVPIPGCTSASPFWNSGTSSWGTFDGLAYGANTALVAAYTSGPPPAVPAPGGVALAQMPLTTGQSSLYSTLLSNVLPSSNVTAVAPLVAWNAVESNTNPGVYSWSTVDSQLLALTAAGKRLRLIVELASESGSSQTAGGGNNATPAYVFGSGWATTVGAANPQDMSVCTNYEGDTGSPYGHSGFTTGGIWNSSNSTYGSDLSGLPVSYEPPFKIAAKRFITQLTQHFSSYCSQLSSDCSNAAQLAPLIDYVRVGFSEGGEDSPLCNSFWPLPTGYTTFQGAYLDGSNSGGQIGYVDEMTAALANAYATYHPAWVFIFDTHDLTGTGHTYADHEALAAARDGFGFGTNGFQASDLTNCPGSLCTSDWYSNFAAYPQVPHYLQTLQTSCPDNSCATGSLVSLLSFAESSSVDALELYPCDLLLADAPGAYPGTGAQACSPAFSTSYSSSYGTAVSGANGR